MAGTNDESSIARGGLRCDMCNRVIRLRGYSSDTALCKFCLSEALPFVGIEADSDYRGALREYREGLGSRASQFQGLKFDPFGDEEREALKCIDKTLRGCKFIGGMK